MKVNDIFGLIKLPNSKNSAIFRFYVKIKDIPLGFYTLKAKNSIKPPTLSLLYPTKIALLNLLGKVGRPFKGNLPTPKTNLKTNKGDMYV